MNITEHLLPELQSTERLKDSTLTRRYLQAKSLEVSRKRSGGKSKYFIPFAQERDHIGRLIKTNTGDSVEYLNNSNSSKSYLSTGVRQHIRAGNDTPEMLTIEQPSSKNVYKMIESSLANRSEEETAATPSSGVNYINLSAHLYSIGRGEHNTLEVKSPKQKIPVESIVEYQGDLTRSGMAPQFDYSTVRSEMDTTDRNENRTKLPPLQLIKNRNAEMGSPPGLNSSLSSKNLRIRGNRDEANTGQPTLDSSASYINLSAWKFEASQLALNKDVESMMRREKKINNRHAMLTIPQRQDIVPPLGSYKPSLSVIKQRPSNCLILPERLPKSKSPEREQRQEECRKLHVEVKKKPVEEDENQTSEEYYKHLFKGMLQEVDQSKTKGSRKTESRQRPVKNKPLDYIVLDDFKRFPGDFEKKVVDMRKKLRLFKDKLNLCKEYKELE